MGDPIIHKIAKKHGVSYHTAREIIFKYFQAIIKLMHKGIAIKVFHLFQIHSNSKKAQYVSRKTELHSSTVKFDK